MMPYLAFCFSRVGLAIGPVAFEFVQILGRSMLMGVSVWFVQDLMVASDWSVYLRLPLAIGVGIAAYSILMWSRIKQSVLPFLVRGNEVQP